MIGKIHKQMSHDSWLFSKMATPEYTPFVFLLLLFQSSVWGFPSCHATKPGMLNVHLVPHTHDDVGWLKTVDQYFYGDRNDIQHAGVQYILDSVVDQLLKNPDRRFIYVETAFFYRWWKQQTDDMQNTVKQLVNEGRLEFVNGGWCMSDEATTHYSAVIDQMTMGLRFLNDTFGHCGRPRVAWHIDPFGHAREHASMFAQMGYDGFFFGRLDYQDRNRRMVAREQEMLWRASESLTPPMADLFTGILPNGYNPPEGFCWDQSCDDPPIRDDPDLEDYNVDDVVTRFLHIAHGQALVYKTNHIIMTMGSDFQYENANLWYKNLDKLIRYVNQMQSNGSEVNVLYSTPSCYLQELHRANLTWPLKGDDFFPYADSAHDFWTGYFTSRPALKRYERISNSYLQTCKQLEVLGGPISRKGPFGAGDSETLSKCLVYTLSSHSSAMAVAQHHDAVSGTEKQHVANDYARKLANGWAHCQVLVSNTLSSLSGSSAPRVYCEHLNISVCPLTETSKKFSVNVYNPLARPVSWPVRLPVNGTAYRISDAKGKAVDSQVELLLVRTTYSLSTLLSLSLSISLYPSLSLSISLYPSLSLSISLYPSLSLSISLYPSLSLSISLYPSLSLTPSYSLYPSIIISPSQSFSPQPSSLLSLCASIVTLRDFLSSLFCVCLSRYNASDGNNSESIQMSGAYIFRPNTSTPFIISKTNSVVQEVRQWFSPWVSQVVRLYTDSRALELEWTVGPVPIGDDLGKEVISRLDSSINSSGVFYTDSNGREMLQRRKDYRPTWNLRQSEPIAGNYYPINSRAYIKDDKDQLTVVTDRSQGGGSIQDGSLEIMLHRRLLYDDVRGVGEPLNEMSDIYPEGLVVRGRHLLSLSPPATAADTHRPLAQEVVLQPLITFTDGELHPSTRLEFSGLQAVLPPAVHLLTVSQWDQDTVLLRLEHQYQASESKEHSQPVTVNLQVTSSPWRYAPSCSVSGRDSQSPTSVPELANDQSLWLSNYELTASIGCK
uniref:Alpha-mannosidase n=1 Tax=Oncorhynchus mykiss TaxID=8022 RepID=A0A8K9UTP7_ONCMY